MGREYWEMKVKSVYSLPKRDEEEIRKRREQKRREGREEEYSIRYNITPARNTNNTQQLKPEHHTNTYHTPQPSTPIKHAGSDIWDTD